MSVRAFHWHKEADDRKNRKKYQQAESFFAQRLEKKNVICYNLTPRRKQGICTPYAIRQFQQNGVTAKTPDAETP